MRAREAGTDRAQVVVGVDVVISRSPPPSLPPSPSVCLPLSLIPLSQILTSFRILFREALKPGGVYFIEDLACSRQVPP